MLMVAVPNIFTRNQLENRFRSDIENLLSGYFGRAIQLAVIVDESLKPADEDFGDEGAYDEASDSGHARQFSDSGNHQDYSHEAYRENSHGTQPGVRKRRLLG